MHFQCKAHPVDFNMTIPAALPQLIADIAALLHSCRAAAALQLTLVLHNPVLAHCCRAAPLPLLTFSC